MNSLQIVSAAALFSGFVTSFGYQLLTRSARWPAFPPEASIDDKRTARRLLRQFRVNETPQIPNLAVRDSMKALAERTILSHRRLMLTAALLAVGFGFAASYNWFLPLGSIIILAASVDQLLLKKKSEFFLSHRGHEWQ